MPAFSAQVEALRDAVTARLAAQADFAGTVVLSRRTAELSSELSESLGRLGVLVLVALGQAGAHPPLRRRPLLDPLLLQVRCVEDPLLNRTGRSAGYLAERALAHLSLWRPDAVAGAFPLAPANPCLVELAPLPARLEQEDARQCRGWDCCLTTRLLLAPAIS